MPSFFEHEVHNEADVSLVCCMRQPSRSLCAMSISHCCRLCSLLNGRRCDGLGGGRWCRWVLRRAEREGRCVVLEGLNASVLRAGSYQLSRASIRRIDISEFRLLGSWSSPRSQLVGPYDHVLAPYRPLTRFAHGFWVRASSLSSTGLAPTAAARTRAW